MRLPLVIATAVVLTVALVVGVVSLGAATADQPPLESITVQAPEILEPVAPGAPPAPAGPPPAAPVEPAPRDQAGYVAPPPPVAGDDDGPGDDDDEPGDDGPGDDSRDDDD